jgi:hypothetical protein
MSGLGPNHYALTGRESLQVIYARTGLGGQPQLTYQNLTLHRLAVDAPTHGQLDTCHLHPLSGTASVVEF